MTFGPTSAIFSHSPCCPKSTSFRKILKPCSLSALSRQFNLATRAFLSKAATRFDGASGFQVDCRDSSYSASVYRLRGEEWVEGLYIGDRFVEGALDVVPAITGTEIVAISENMADIREAGINFHVPVGIDVGRRSITYNPHTGEVMGISEKSKDICTIVDLEVPVPEGFAGREWYASHRKIDLIHDFDTGKTSVGRRVDLNSHLLGQDSVVPLVEASVDDPDRKIYDAVRAELRGRSGIRRDINDTGIVMGVLQQYFPN